MKFTKMHGAGNDYIYFDGFKYDIVDPNALSIKLSDRHKSVGGDGIVIILPSKVADFRMRMFNADGSEGKMCGNATRCIGKYVYDKGLTNKTDVTLETLSGIKQLHLNVKDGCVESVVVNMGCPILNAKEIPVISDKEQVIGEKVILNGKEHTITCVSMGNPHCVIFTKDIDSLPLDKIGTFYENDKMFPERVNTEFVEILSPTHLKMRVWERGSGETMACGTGACASVVASVINGYSPKDEFIKVSLIGGDLQIKYCANGEVEMDGGAEFAFEGEIKD